MSEAEVVRELRRKLRLVYGAIDASELSWIDKWRLKQGEPISPCTPSEAIQALLGGLG